MRGLEVLLRSEPRGPRSHGVQWQTGRMLRVRGTALWWQGQMAEVTAVLYLSAWILRQTLGARLHLGDALHALGRLLRSQGSERYPTPRQRSKKPAPAIAITSSRTLIDLACVELSMGLLFERAASAGNPRRPLPMTRRSSSTRRTSASPRRSR